MNLDKKSKSDKRHKKTKKRKGKKGKSPAMSSGEEEDGGATPLHVVNTDIGEMPEGVEHSDTEEGETRPSSDPHRALNIDLDMPLRDEEKLPVRVHRISDITAPAGLKPKKSNHKKEKSKKHRSKAAKEDPAVVESHHKEDIDLWLTQDPAEYEVVNSDNEGAKMDAAAPTESLPKKVKEKKEKKEKKKSKEGKKAKKSLFKEGYEEAAGISTPSKEMFNEALTDSSQVSASQQPPLTAYRKLAEDKTLQLMFEIRTLPQETNQIVVSILLTNKTTSLIKEMDFSISDSQTVKLIRANTDNEFGIKLHFHLTSNSASEAQFAFEVSDVTFPQKLRTTLTYMAQGDGGSTHEKLDFWLPLPCTSFLIGRVASRDTVTDLLSSGTLSQRSSITVDIRGADFSQVLSRVCFHCHLTLVELVEQTASLYARSLLGHHICLLTKYNNATGHVSLEGKTNCEPLLANLLAEIKELLEAT